MLTRVNVNDDLLEEARQLGKHGTAKEAATAVLKEYIKSHHGRVPEELDREPEQKLRQKPL